MKKGGRGFKGVGGASFCHHCNKQLQFKAGGGLYFTMLLTPHDQLPVRVHVTCTDKALAEGYRKAA